MLIFNYIDLTCSASRISTQKEPIPRSEFTLVPYLDILDADWLLTVDSPPRDRLTTMVKLKKEMVKTGFEKWKTLNSEICEKIGPVRISHSSHHIATQSSHFVHLAGWQGKMASIEFWIPWRNAHKPHWWIRYRLRLRGCLRESCKHEVGKEMFASGMLQSAHKNTLHVLWIFCVRGRLLIGCGAPRPTAWRGNDFVSFFVSFDCSIATWDCVEVVQLLPVSCPHGAIIDNKKKLDWWFL